MDAFQVGLFVVGTFVAALVSGLSGFAFGVVAASIWLYVLAPVQVTALIAVFGLMISAWTMWQLRAALHFARLWPFLVGATLGVPIGAELVRAVDPLTVRRAVGVFLLVFTTYSMARPEVRVPTAGGRVADGAAAVMSGIVGAATGFAGIVTVVWCAMRGWPRDEQRVVFQSVAVLIFVLSLAWLGGRSAIAGETLRLMAIGAPALLLGLWAGFSLYGKLDEVRFRKVVLVLLGVSGLALIAA